MIQPTPIDIGTTPITVAPTRLNRKIIRFQNIGETNLYFVRQVGGTNVPSSDNFEFELSHTGQSVDFIDVESIAQFNAVSSGKNGRLAIFETIKVPV